MSRRPQLSRPSLVRFVRRICPIVRRAVRRLHLAAILLRKLRKITMTTTNHECWSRVKGRLRAEVGEDVFSSWFARMELEGVEIDTVRLSVPTRFLKSWIQSHYVER